MQQPIPYLSFKDNAAEAMTFYQQVLGGTLQVLTFGDSPGCEDMPPEAKGLTMHAALAGGAALLMASDTPPHMTFEPIKGVSLSLSFADIPEAERILATLGAGGTVIMPMAETFWVERFGMVTDRFGVTWMINGGAMKQM